MDPVQLPFQAQWRTFAPPPPIETTWGKCVKIFWNVLSVLIPVILLVRWIGWKLDELALQAILPSQEMKKENDTRGFDALCRGEGPYANTWKAERHTVITPDRAELSIKLLYAKSSNPDERTETILYFPGNSELPLRGLGDFSMPHHLVKADPSSLHKYNFVFLDYRGTGDSRGRFTSPQDLITDGASVLEWISHKDGLWTAENQIHFVGWSLGGAVSIATQALSPTLTGRNCNILSFSSLSRTIEEILKDEEWPTLGKLAGWFLRVRGLDLDVTERALALTKRGVEMLVVSDKRDPIISRKASLIQSLDWEDQDPRYYDQYEDIPPLRDGVLPKPSHYHCLRFPNTCEKIRKFLTPPSPHIGHRQESQESWGQQEICLIM